MIYPEVLTSLQKKLLPKLTFLKERGFYLAGGTALALLIKHRTSIDFDFYTGESFDPNEIRQKLIKDLNILSSEITIAPDTLLAHKEKMGISLFKYPYKLIKPWIKTEYLNVASLEDIAAMKLLAITQRGWRRDFIDLYFLIKNLGIKNIFKFAEKKFPEFNPYNGLIALTFFEDAEKNVPENRPLRLFRPIDWPEIKKYLIKQADDYRKLWRKK